MISVGLVIGGLTVIVVGLVAELLGQAAAQRARALEAGRVECPHCREGVMPMAAVCPHCTRGLREGVEGQRFVRACRDLAIEGRRLIAQAHQARRAAVLVCGVGALLLAAAAVVSRIAP